jgi:hypothetical protein
MFPLSKHFLSNSVQTLYYFWTKLFVHIFCYDSHFKRKENNGIRQKAGKKEGNKRGKRVERIKIEKGITRIKKEDKKRDLVQECIIRNVYFIQSIFIAD